MTELLAIDPGNTESAYVAIDPTDCRPVDFGKVSNGELLGHLQWFMGPVYVEMIASYGMPVGAEVFETCVWIGRFVEAWGGGASRLVYRREVKLHLCANPRAKDANIRQALIDKWGGKLAAVGSAKSRGPLYGVSADVWAALGVAVTVGDDAAHALPLVGSALALDCSERSLP